MSDFDDESENDPFHNALRAFKCEAGETISGPYGQRNDHPVYTYEFLYKAFDYLNFTFFEGKLSPCLITLNRTRGAAGSYSPDRMVKIDDVETVVDEITMNPCHFYRPVAEVLSTLTHEMCHAYQQREGHPGRGSYHNREFANLLKSIGLYPSSTGAPGGAECGDHMSHFIIEFGPFDHACKAFLAEHSPVLYQDLAYIPHADNGGMGGGSNGNSDAPSSGGSGDGDRRSRKLASKTAFTCSGCAEETAWAKPSACLRCGRCNFEMRPGIKKRKGAA